ncbi:MAG: hypothetical protein A2527_02000 [Candidatus Lambdaproteobacteria bacterium RIFOXYD2_FULL_50_16]|uniref:Lipid A biosynthesis acyltransferase n=1 Tax=Candidatus Lambdaproteobacteria bacterium RIFOXYD2_FULL_50_16 TaxID=1817772 RepID=A0A1F6G6X8_9PROT|nr:MAG: hypothetical protein A2527_02000 [Candidatus Lambdaproteobacteria bacterium RIFOXYD2_FULL_50_16]
MGRDQRYDDYKKHKSPKLKAVRHFLERQTLAGFTALVQGLSIPQAQAWGKRLGRLSYRFAKKDVSIARYQLEFALPNLDTTEREALILECAENVGQTLLESLLMDRFREQAADWISLSGGEALIPAKEAGQGGIIIFAHMGNWELLSVVYDLLEIRGLVMKSQVGEEELDQKLVETRRSGRLSVVPRGEAGSAKAILSCFKAGEFFLMGIDQDLSNVQSRFVPFFGRLAATPKGPAQLAIKFGVPVFGAFGRRGKEGRHHFELVPLCAPPYQGGEREEQVLTEQFSLAIETQIRKQPGQWVWFHRRWKTQPDETP